MEPMKGYKALDMDMRAVHGNGMQFELGKWHSLDGDMAFFHDDYFKNELDKKYFLEGNMDAFYCNFLVCEEIEYLAFYHSIKDCRIFEADTDWGMAGYNGTYVAEKIRLARELTQKEINSYFMEYQDIFIGEPAWQIRKALAEQGYGLEILVKDENWRVREAVAEQGYGLEILVNDEDRDVRTAVAGQGYGLDVFIHDESYWVRQAVAKQGYGLEILIHDKDWDVRETAKWMLSRADRAQQK